MLNANRQIMSGAGRGRNRRRDPFSRLLFMLFAVAGAILLGVEPHRLAPPRSAIDQTVIHRAESANVVEPPPEENTDYTRIEEFRTEGEAACRRALQPWPMLETFLCGADFDVFLPGSIGHSKRPPASGRQLQSLFTQELPKRAGPPSGDGIPAACLA